MKVTQAKEGMLTQWGGPNALAHWRAAGAPPDVAAYGALLLGRLRNAAYSFSMKGELNAGFHDHFIGKVVQARQFKDFEDIFRSQRTLFDTLALGQNIEKEVSSKNLSTYLPDAGMLTMEEEPRFRRDASNIRTWDEAQHFLRSVFSPAAPHPVRETVSAQVLCQRYGLSSVMVPIHLENPQDLLQRLDDSLNAVCRRMGIEEYAALGGYGRLSISFSKTKTALASGASATFDHMQEGFLALQTDYDESTLHHECFHWLDSMARWAISPDGTGKNRSDCLSSLDERRFPQGHPARIVKDAIARFAEDHPAYIEAAHKADIALHAFNNRMARLSGSPEKPFSSYYLAAQEILARAFEYGVKREFSRQFEFEAFKCDSAIGEGLDALARECLRMLRPPAVKWAEETRLEWAESVQWNGRAPREDIKDNEKTSSKSPTPLSEEDDLLLRSFSSLPSVAKAGVGKLRSFFRI